MDQRISLITLSVTDMDRASAFYDALGWARVPSPDGVIAYDLLGQTLGLYPREALARDMGLPVSALGHGAMTLGYNCREKVEVDALYTRALAAGADGLAPPHDIFWGGYSSYIRDPEGHIWELAWNPFSPLRADGAFRWSGYGD